MIDPELEAAYRTTRYRVDVPASGRIELHIGEFSPDFSAALKQAGVQYWAIVVAANPHSVSLPVAENERRHWQLCEAVRAAGWPFWPGLNLAPAGSDWPAEPSLCLLDIDREAALRLADSFEQNAVILPDEQGRPMLVWTDQG
jgi:hypothetical protein